MSYRDSEDRYQHDPLFRAAVESLRAFAEEHEYTPGELRQIASMAAYLVEMHRGVSFQFIPRGPL